MFIWLVSIVNWIISMVFNLVIFKLMAILAFLLIVD